MLNEINQEDEINVEEIYSKQEENTNETSRTTSEVFNENNELEIDWKIRLVNKDNPMPEGLEIELANIDKTRKFDKRAIEPLMKMLDDMREQGISNIWVQSAYRSVEYQKQLYNQSIEKYMNQGYSMEVAQELTNQYINIPGTSEHNLGLAVDFNNVDEGFENTKAYIWLQQYASSYGFILRYPEDKANITNVAYEPWHWRYVGEEHAKKIKEMNFCLEEYIQYLNGNKEQV